MLQHVRPVPPTPTAAPAITDPDRALSHASGDVGAWPVARPRSGTAPGLVLALALHAAVVLPLLLASPEPMGAGGTDLEAISVEVTVVAATARESLAAAEASAPPSAASVDMAEGAVMVSAAALQTAATADARPDAAVPTTAALPPTQPVAESAAEPASSASDPEALQLESRPETAATEPPPEPPAKAQPEPSQTPPRPDPDPEPDPKAAVAVTPAAPAASIAQQSGGAAARATAAAENSRAAAAPSPGAIKAFARGVVEALGRSRPKGLVLPAKGTVRVAFAVAAGGGLDFVRIAASSGSRVLDDTAVGAVRRTSFPVPPAGMDLLQRTYEVPYHFR